MKINGFKLVQLQINWKHTATFLQPMKYILI